MTRPAFLGCLAPLICAAPLLADPPKLGPAPPIPEPPPPQSPTSTEAGADPFQQAPRDQAAASDDLRRASEAFAAKRYAQAATLFAEADHRHERLTDGAEGRMGVLPPVQRGRPAEPRAGDGHRVGGPGPRGGSRLARRLDPVAAVRQPVARRHPPPQPGGRRGACAAGLAGHRDGEFPRPPQGSGRIGGRSGPHRRSGPAGDVRALGRPAGRELVAQVRRLRPPQGGRLRGRDGQARGEPGALDGRYEGRPSRRAAGSTCALDEPAMLDGVLPSEVTQVVLAELFADQPLPAVGGRRHGRPVRVAGRRGPLSASGPAAAQGEDSSSPSARSWSGPSSPARPRSPPSTPRACRSSPIW